MDLTHGLKENNRNRKQLKENDKIFTYHNLWNEAKVVLRRKFILSNAYVREKGLKVNDLGIYLKKLGEQNKMKCKGSRTVPIKLGQKRK